MKVFTQSWTQKDTLSTCSSTLPFSCDVGNNSIRAACLQPTTTYFWFTTHNHSYYSQRWQINTLGVMFQLIQYRLSPKSSWPFWKLQCVMAVKLWACVTPLASMPIDSLSTSPPLSSLFTSPKTTTTATQLLFGLFPGQVLSVSTTTHQATQLVDCLCLLTLLPSLPGSPGWPGTPANPWGIGHASYWIGCSVYVVLQKDITLWFL